MLKFKLTRIGKKREPHFRIVVGEARSKNKGWFVDEIGNYNPVSKILTLDKVKAKDWLSKGVQPTPTVATLFVKENILKQQSKVQKTRKKKTESK